MLKHRSLLRIRRPHDSIFHEVFRRHHSARGLARVADRRIAQPQAAIELPADVACPGFAVRLQANGQPQVFREFKDKDRQVVRMISAGRGSVLTFTNMSSGASTTFKTGGSVSHTTVNPDGTWTVAGTGLNTIILFPTDTPAGPSTVLYIGRIVYTLTDPGGENIFTLQSFHGTSKDICEVLSA